MGEPTRRHSSPAPSIDRRRSCGGAITGEGKRTDSLPSALKYKDPHGGACPVRHLEDYRTLYQYRKRSAGDQSIISVRIDENDGDEEDSKGDDDVDNGDVLAKVTGGNIVGGAVEVACVPPATTTTETEERTETMLLAMRRASLKRNNTGDSEVESRVAQILHEIEYSATDSVDESKILSTHSSTDAPTVRVEAQTQTLSEHELEEAVRQRRYNCAIPASARMPRCNVHSDQVKALPLATGGTVEQTRVLPLAPSGGAVEYSPKFMKQTTTVRIFEREIEITESPCCTPVVAGDIQFTDKSTEIESASNSVSSFSEVTSSYVVSTANCSTVPQHECKYDLDEIVVERRRLNRWLSYLKPSAWALPTRPLNLRQNVSLPGDRRTTYDCRYYL